MRYRARLVEKKRSGEIAPRRRQPLLGGRQTGCSAKTGDALRNPNGCGRRAAAAKKEDRRQEGRGARLNLRQGGRLGP
jgi:hypothetical protein